MQDVQGIPNTNSTIVKTQIKVSESLSRSSQLILITETDISVNSYSQEPFNTETCLYSTSGE